MDGEVVIGTSLDTKGFEKQIELLEQKLDGLEKQRKLFANAGTEEDLKIIKEIDAEIEKTKNSIIGLQQKQMDLAGSNGFAGIDLHLDSIIKKVTKWGMALFGIRSMYTAIRSAMSMLSQEDDNLSAQIDYIKWTLASAIAPVIKFIINAVKLILDYVNAIWRFLFGFDLFKGPKEFAKSIKSASGSAEKIKKSLAGFDEMNILGDNTAAAGGGGVTTPEFDTEDVTKGLQKVKDKVIELKKTYVESTEDMNKALKDPKAFRLAYGNWDWLMMGIVEIVAGINTVVMGIGDIFGGLFKVIKGIFTLNIKEILEGFMQMGEGVAKIFRGLFQIIDGIFLTIVGLIKGVVLTITNFFSGVPEKIGNFFTKAKDNIMKVFSAETGKKIGKALTDGISNAVKSGLNWIIDKINAFTGLLNKLNINVAGKDYGFNIKSIPRLAKGTILNNPGRGVPVAGGNAIAGEAGREAFLPLSDTQLLEELGSTIGRYITINLTNETKLDGRTIARKVSQLSNNDNFLRNR